MTREETLQQIVELIRGLQGNTEGEDPYEELRPLVKDATPGIPREWLRVSEAMKYTGLSKPTLYSLFNRGLVKTASLKQRGKLRGVRLVSFDSLRDFLESRSSGGITE